MKHGLFIFCMLISLCFPMAFSQQATTVIKPEVWQTLQGGTITGDIRS